MISAHIFHQTVTDFLEPIALFLADDSVSEVMINRFDRIYVERGGCITRTDATFGTEHALMAAVKNVAQYVGRIVDAEHPILDARLPDGSRVAVMLPPASRAGVCMSIRRFPKQRLTVERLLKVGALTEACRDFLSACVLAKRNVVVAGGTGSGKTSMLNALSSFVPEGERILVLEDSSELQLEQEHAVYMESIPPDARGRGAVSIRDLLRASLRMRPDRIVVGECRGGEALDLIQAMTSGHGGSLSTVHATYPHDTVQRLETLCLMSDVALPLAALRQQIASAVNVIVQTGRYNDGSRRITHVAECRGLTPEGQYDLGMLYLFEQDGCEPGSGRVRGRLACTGRRPSFADDLLSRGLSLDPEMRA
ncbi:MAG: Type secretion system hydrolase TadA/VirB11/CpaF, TadA subfamily protein [Myxococcales bacterium]|nr:Type secretion system hydrolase TadA/VirB11/CpaF, TadA subfamily protein [Myxococcales bacterium]